MPKIPSGISNSKNPVKLEDEASKPTLAVSGNTANRVGLLLIALNTPLPDLLTRAPVSAHYFSSYHPFFSFP